jgi:hypothetical protein
MAMTDEIVNRILTRLSEGKKAVSFAPVTEQAIAEAEANLGFAIPHLLRSIYLNVGNGGFGPGYGILGVRNGHTAALGTLVETYEQMRNGAEYLGFEWQPGLLPFCEWGCNISSCVDGLSEENRVCRSDACVAHVLKYNLEDFFNMWLSGVNILDVERPPRRSVSGINPFTGKPHTFRQ